MFSRLKRSIKKRIVRIKAKLGLIPPLPGTQMTDSEVEADRTKYIQLDTSKKFAMGKKYDFICKGDKYANNGIVKDSSYFIQDIWGARKVAEHKPSVHYDVGSSVVGFIAHLLGMNQKICLIDIRPMNSLDTSFLNAGGGVRYIQADATNLEHIEDNSIESISALCSVEHFGLGRYGDPINPDAWYLALKSFQRVVKSGGRIYISVPVGVIDKVCFNAHRVYRPQTIIESFDKCDIVEFSYIKGFDTIICMQRDNSELKIHGDNLKSIPDIKNNGVTGLFEFIKR